MLTCLPESPASRATADLFDFDLPAELEAREPPEARGLSRDGVRLLISRETGLDHARFVDLPDRVAPGDLLVVNDSATLPARLIATPAGGEGFRLHLSNRLTDEIWIVEPRQMTSPVGSRLSLPGGGTARLISPYRGSGRLWIAQLDLPEPWLDYLVRWGAPIAYPYLTAEWPIAAYQTLFARHPGSAEMPSAGRPFTPAVVQRLAERGIDLAAITLHTGVASLERDEPPYDEWFAVPETTVDAVTRARRAGGRVIAVGTTVVRALESAVLNGRLGPTTGWTDRVITPDRGVSIVDGLLTGLHEPRASHLLMLEAIAGRHHLTRAYQAALTGRYLWHEFGDLHLILRDA